MSNGDNVVPFPRGRRGRQPKETPSGVGLEQAVQAQLDRLMAEGLDPEAAARVILEGAGVFLSDARVPPASPSGGRGPLVGFEVTRVEPTLLARRPETVTFRVRLDLDGATPKIWRRLDLPSDLPLDRLHDVIQAAMGWTDSHLHAFQMGPSSRDRRIARFVTAWDREEGEEGINEEDVRLDEVLGEVGDRLFYEYDFGDSWDHTITLEAILPAGQVGCVAGRRACPPEDCGGIGGHHDIVDVLTGVTVLPDADADADLAGGADDRTEPVREATRAESPLVGLFDSYEELLAWLPPGYDPAAFNLAATDAVVRDVVAGRIPGLPPHEDLNPVLAGLIDRCSGYAAEMVAALTAAAVGGARPMEQQVSGSNTVSAGRGDATEAKTAEGVDVAAATRSLRVVLDVIGDGGAELTPAGYLRSALVEEIFTRCEMGRDWIGMGNREDLTPPVATARAAVQRLGLVRRTGRQLVWTRAGRTLRDDPEGLWRHAASRLPAGTSATQRDAGMLLLLAVATGGGIDEYAQLAADVLRAAGSVGPRGIYLSKVCEPTWDVLAAVNLPRVGARRDFGQAAQALARAALLTGV